MNWQPIETSPTDTDVLVYFEFATVPIVHIARRGSRERWEESGQYCGRTLEDFLSWWSYTRDSVRQEKLEGFCNPWYWMPLPEIPGTGKEPVENPKENAYDFTLRVLTLIGRKDLHSTFYLKPDVDAAPLTFFLNCDHLIAWGSADAMDITPDNIERLEKTIEECESIDSDDGAIIGCDLFVCQERKMRPQGACYPEDRRFWPLFDACGPEREVGLGNPFAPGWVYESEELDLAR